MNPLIKLIQINHSFQKSVNLQLDLDNYERIGSYIPTRSSIAILKRYWNIVSGKSGESASVLIGPYGKGKSHLLLVLLAVLSMERTDKNSEIIKKLINKIKDVDEIGYLVADNLKKIWKKENYVRYQICKRKS